MVGELCVIVLLVMPLILVKGATATSVYRGDDGAGCEAYDLKLMLIAAQRTSCEVGIVTSIARGIEM